MRDLDGGAIFEIPREEDGVASGPRWRYRGERKSDRLVLSNRVSLIPSASTVQVLKDTRSSKAKTMWLGPKGSKHFASAKH